MTIQLEVCIDNIESLHNAIQGGATRIELCSSLALGGLTPSYGFMKQAALQSSVPVYAMIRPRQGDFLYSDDEIEIMLDDVDMAKKAGLDGVVFGALTAAGDIDMPTCQRIMAAAQGMGSTFHRAIDQCRCYQQAIEDIATLGCERILTSGLAAKAHEGLAVLIDMVKLVNDRFEVMAGAGVSANNAREIILNTGVKQIHLSGKSSRPSKMQLVADLAKMGADNLDDFLIPITDQDNISKVREVLNKLA